MDSVNYIQGIYATKTNTIVTLISIVFTIITIVLTIKNKKYKQQVFAVMNTIDLMSYWKKYHSIYLKVSSTIRTPDSNNGGNNNKAISQLNNILREFNVYEKKIPEEDRKIIKTNVDSVLDNITSLWDGTADKNVISSFKSRLDTIDRKLIEITDKMIKE